MFRIQRIGARGEERLAWPWVALFGVLSTLALLQTSPWVVRTPGNDSGIFLYFGAQILRGRLPFVDLWDHKPPLVFYLNALGLFLGGLAAPGEPRWGVWAVELAALLAACLFAFAFLRRYFGTWPALLAVTGLLANLAFVIEGGNLTEEYALAFQFAAIYLFTRFQNDPRPGWRADSTKPMVLAGAAIGCAFLLKQTLIGTGLAMGIYLVAVAVFNRARQVWAALARAAAGFAAGFACVVLSSVIYFALRGGLASYWDVAFGYNFLYSSVASIDRLNSMLDVLSFLNTRAGFFMLAVMAWPVGWMYVLLHHRLAAWYATRRWAGLAPLAGSLVFLANGLFVRPFQIYALNAISPYRWGLIGAGLALLIASLVFFGGWTERRLYPWLQSYQPPDAAAQETPAALLPLSLALIDFPLNVALIALPGRGYLHYYLALFPSMTILVAFLAWTVAERVKGSRNLLPAVCSAALLLPILYGGVAFTVQKIHPGADLQTSTTVSYIQQNTRPGDTILMWGTQTGIYFLAGRASPTRYVHQIPLFNPAYATPERIQEYLSDIQRKQPALIIDTREGSMPLVYQPGDPAGCGTVQVPNTAPEGRGGSSAIGTPARMAAVYSYICANYQPVDVLGPDQWIVYSFHPTN